MPDRQQSLHDNLLGNLQTAGLDQRYGVDSAMNLVMQGLISAIDADLLTRAYNDGSETNAAQAAQTLAWDMAKGYVPAASGTLTATDVDAGDVLTWSISGASSYGTMTIDAGTGVWTYRLDSGRGHAGAHAGPSGQRDVHGDGDRRVRGGGHPDGDHHGLRQQRRAGDQLDERCGDCRFGDGVGGDPVDVPGINEAGAGGALEPTLALNATITAALASLLTAPADVPSVVTTVQAQLGGTLAQAIVVVWDYLDDIYVSAGANQPTSTSPSPVWGSSMRST